LYQDGGGRPHGAFEAALSSQTTSRRRNEPNAGRASFDRGDTVKSAYDNPTGSAAAQNEPNSAHNRGARVPGLAAPRRPVLAVLAALTCLALPPSRGDDFDPTERYESRDVEGWTVLINQGFLEAEPELAARTLDLLRHQLYQIVRRLPDPAVERLRSVRIWVEEKEPHHPCMAYHPHPGWLRDHGMNPEKARCVEVANARNFLTWTIQQPWMVFHELAHAYHHQFLDGGYGNNEVRTAYREALDAQLYDKVLHINGREQKAYATTNPMEYFAETSEAFFGTNDFFPFVRSELKLHDPKGFAMLRQAWRGERDEP
jgi:hypothetical protein